MNILTSIETKLGWTGRTVRSTSTARSTSAAGTDCEIPAVLVMKGKQEKKKKTPKIFETKLHQFLL